MQEEQQQQQAAAAAAAPAAASQEPPETQEPPTTPPPAEVASSEPRVHLEIRSIVSSRGGRTCVTVEKMKISQSEEDVKTAEEIPDPEPKKVKMKLRKVSTRNVQIFDKLRNLRANSKI